MTNLLAVAAALMAGLLMTRIFKLLHLKFPDVTAFLLAGVFVGPFMLGKLDLPGLGFQTPEQVEACSVISNAALGFIAFDIGNEFRMSELKKTGRQALVIGILQALLASILVDVVLVTMSLTICKDVLSVPAAITLGAIASATAPAATLMVVRQYKAEGPVTKLLLPIVALDDAVGLVVFAVSFGVARAMQGGGLSVVSVVVNPLLEIVFSLGLGALMGVLLTRIEKLFFSNSNRLSMTIAFVLITIALASHEFAIGPELRISFSSLLVCMMLGTVFCNMSTFSEDIMERSERWTAPLYAVFFVLSGAELDLRVFRKPVVLLIGVVYILTRSLGKYVGARSSSSMMGCDGNVRKYLGITLLPQAGVALGMVVTAQALGEAEGSFIRNIILFSVMIYELAGPMLTKQALKSAGEIREEGRKVSRKENRK